MLLSAEEVVDFVVSVEESVDEELSYEVEFLAKNLTDCMQYSIYLLKQLGTKVSFDDLPFVICLWQIC